MKTCGVQHPRNPDIKCMKLPHKGEWHKVVDGTGGTHEYRVKPPKPSKRKLDTQFAVEMGMETEAVFW